MTSERARSKTHPPKEAPISNFPSLLPRHTYWVLGIGYSLALGIGLWGFSPAFPAEPLYLNDFTRAELGSLPDDEFLVLDGAFQIKEENDNRFIELPGAPLDTFGAIFGPARRDGVSVSARIWADQQGRRFPTFGVGLCGAGGYRLQVSPAKKTLELYKGDEWKTSTAYNWKPAHWTALLLQVRAMGGQSWKIQGKAWTHGDPEPAEWMIALDDTEPPSVGRASFWGSPFSGKPIRFDDLLVQRAPEK